MAKIGTIEAVITAKVEPLRRALDEATKGFVQFEGRVTASQKQVRQLSTVLSREVAQATNKAERGVKSLATSTLNLGRAISAAAAAWASSKLVQGLNDFARTAHEAEAGARVFEKMLARVGESSRRVEPELQALADELRVAPEIIRSNAAELLRAGYTWDQIATIYRGAGASALLAGKSTAQGVEIATSALVSGLSTYLNQIGITQNLSTAYTQYARQLGKTVEQLTDAERAEAATLMIHKATAQEVEDLQILFEGYGGAVSDLNRAWYDFRVTLGSLVMPVVEQVIRILTRAIELATEAINRLRQLAGREPVEVLAPVEATVQQAAEAGEDAGHEWAVAFAREANRLVDLVGPGRIWEILRPVTFVSEPGGGFQRIEQPPEVFGGPAAIREWLGLADATQEELDKVLELVQQYADRLAADKAIGEAIAEATGTVYDPVQDQLQATQRLLRDLVEEAGMPISSPFAQQLLEWITILNNQLPKTKRELSEVQKFVLGLQALMGGAIPAGTVQYELAVRLLNLQTQAESGNVILAEAARRQIDTAVRAFHDAFLETGDAAKAAAVALETFAREAEDPLARERERALEQIAEDMARYRMTETEFFGWQLERQAAQFRALGIDEAIIRAWKTAQWDQFFAARADEAARKLDGLGREVSELDRLIAALRGAGETDLAGALAELRRQAESEDLFVSRIAQERIDEATRAFWSALYDTGDVAEAAAEALAKLRGAAEEAAPGLWAQLRDRISELFVRGAPIASSVASAAQMAAPGGPAAMAGAGLIALASHSKQLQTIMSAVNAVLQVLANILGAFLEPLLPLVTLFHMIVQVVGVMLRPAIEIFSKALEALWPVFKFVALVILQIAKAIGDVWNGIISAIQSVFKTLGSISIFGLKPFGFMNDWAKSLERIKVDTDAMAEMIRDLTDLTWEEAKARARELDEIENVTEALRNVPQGFKIALRRFQVTNPVPMADGGIVTRPTVALIGEAGPEAVVPLGGDGAALGTTIVVNIEGPVYGVDDLDRRITTAVGRAMRQARMAAYGVT